MRTLAAAFFVFGCATTPRDHSAPKPVEAPSERTLTFLSGGRELSTDALWSRASAGDPMDLGTLATREGARTLIEVAEQGGASGAVALGALPLARDARAERDRACRLLSRVRVEERPVVLRAVHGLLCDAPELHEALAPGADGICETELRALLDDSALPADQQDLAASALERLH